MRLSKVVARLSVFLAILHLFALTASSQSVPQAILPTGKVIEKVAVQSRPDQSYAAYLPSSYSDARAWPTVFCFDPRARGTTAISRFVSGAEKYGFVIVCSNNSRNALDWPTISQIFTSFWADAHNRFHIDEKRTYAAGFSGGSRIATTFASRCRGCISGVIACGAGFPADTEPDAGVSFKYFGIAGVDDFNFAEMWELERKFEKLRVPYNFENFQGGHEWAPQDNLERAMAWLTLHAMKDGLVARDPKFIEEQFFARLNGAKRLLNLHELVFAERALSSIARDFQGLMEINSIAATADELRRSDEFKKAVRTEDGLIRRQFREAEVIRSLWLKPAEPDDLRLPRQDAALRIREWRKKKDATNDSPDRRLARRILSQLFIGSFESAQASLTQSKDYTLALTHYQLAQEIDPKNYNLAYEIARILALKRERKPALQALELAVSLGFKDVSRLKSEEAFALLEGEAGFQKLLSSIK